MKKSLLALFTAMALTSGMAMADAVNPGTTPPAEPTVDDLLGQTPNENGNASAEFTWSGDVPEYRKTDGVWYIDIAPGSKDFHDGALIFDNDGSGIELKYADTLSFHVYKKAADGTPDTKAANFTYALQTLRVGINEAPTYYAGGPTEYFNLISNDGNALVPANLSNMDALNAKKHLVGDAVKLTVVANDAVNANTELAALDVVTVKAAIIVTSADATTAI